MKRNRFKIYTVLLLLLNTNIYAIKTINYTEFVNKFIGTGADGCVTPVASLPFGMVQIGVDTRPWSSGYRYEDNVIMGISHLHKSGGGCGDLLDVLFLPLSTDFKLNKVNQLKREQYFAKLDHTQEKASPGYYNIKLYDNTINVELTATLRCGMQRYNFTASGSRMLMVDLEYGNKGACTIQQTQDMDTVVESSIEKIDDYTIRGSRISNGWSKLQHVYFYTRFSEPIKKFVAFRDNQRSSETLKVTGRNLRVIIEFGSKIDQLNIGTGISAVDFDGAQKNYEVEIAKKDFEVVQAEAKNVWNSLLGQINIKTSDRKKREIFYTSLQNVFMYPMLYSDVDFRYRGADHKISKTNNYPYYGGVVGLWDTFRAACPLLSWLRPNVMNSYVRTLLAHYTTSKQLPIWVLNGTENYQMTGIHSLPVITNAYLNGIKGFSTDLAVKAMKESAMKDSCGTSMGYFVGLKNYKKYGYVPCDMEMESVARTLEYAYDDWALACFLKAIGNENDDYTYFLKRSDNYRNIFDQNTLFMRGKSSSGKWRTPFDPLLSSHRRDDYCEGNAWQWSFFVPHDVTGFASLMGGSRIMEQRLDSLFTMHSKLTGSHISSDISGLVGQYAHGNEPSHHIAYMYNVIGKPEKTQYYVNHIKNTLYDNTPQGMCGQEDTGQMSAWYVFSALGFYPMDPSSGIYQIGTPSFEKVSIRMMSGNVLTIIANNLSEKNCYVKSIKYNGAVLKRSFITYDEINKGGEILFEMYDGK